MTMTENTGSTSATPSFWQRTWHGLQATVSAHPVAAFIGLLLLVRCGFILFSPLDLIADESYYWDWSRRLDYGYYSKPPMIAWINWLSTSLLGPSEFAVRLPAALLGTFGLLWIYYLGRQMFDSQTGLLAAALLALTPGQTALSFLMTIDAPFLFCWVAALYCFWQMLQHERPPLYWCGWTMLFLGVGLLSKQTMLGFFPLVGLFLLATPAKRHFLLSGRLWGTAVASLMFLIPVVYWNYQHDWITLEHTASHFSDSSVTYWKQFVRFAEFFFGQIGVVSPVLWGVVCVTLLAAFRRFPQLKAEERYLLCMSGVPLIAIFCLSATRRLEPNWPAACYPAGVILASAVLLGRSSLSNVFQRPAHHLKWCWRVGLTGSALTYAAITIVPASPLAGSPVDITCRLRGWRELAHQFESVQEQQAGVNGEYPLIISTAGRDITSALAFYLPQNPLVPFWNHDEAGVTCQYDMWDRPDVASHRDILVVKPEGTPLPVSLEQTAASWEPVADLNVSLGGNRQRAYQVIRLIPASASTAATPSADSVEKTATLPDQPTSPTLR